MTHMPANSVDKDVFSLLANGLYLSFYLTLLLILCAFGTIAWKWWSLRHIPTASRAPAFSYLLGDMLHYGPMAEPFRTSTYIASLCGGPHDILLYRFYLCEPRIMLLSPLAAVEVMHNAAVWTKPPMTRAMLQEAVGASGLLLAEGEQHKELRRLILPMFCYENLKTFGEVFLSHGLALCDQWYDKLISTKDDSHIKEYVDLADVHDDIAHVSMNVIGTVVLGHKPEREELYTSYRAFLDRHNMSHVALIITFLSPNIAPYIPLPEIRESRKLLRQIRSSIEKLVNAKQRHMNSKNGRKATRELSNKQGTPSSPKFCDGAQSRSSENRHVDFLDLLLNQRTTAQHIDRHQNGTHKKGRADLSEAEIVDQALMFMAAGHATTSAAFSWLLFHLATHPQEQSLLRQETESKFPNGVSGNLPPNWLDIVDSLPLLDAVIHESLRLTPAINMTARIAKERTSICGYNIPAGTIVSIPMQALQRCPVAWGPDAQEFRPGRVESRHVWKTDNTDYGSSSWMPFLRGSRACIGARLATLEMKCLAVTLLAANLRLQVTPGCEPSAMGVILVPKGLSLRLSRWR